MKKIFNVVENAGIPYVTFNIDDPNSNRLSYIGSDYSNGGRLAANFIGKALTLKKDAQVLVIGLTDKVGIHVSQHPIFGDRFDGFVRVMHTHNLIFRENIDIIHNHD